MSAGFRAVHWNGAKVRYDAIVLAALAAWIIGYHVVVGLARPPGDRLAWVDIRIHAFGTAAFLMVTAALAIGPLARLDPRFLPALHNRRHLGVLTFLTALLHALFMVEWYWLQGTTWNIIGELTAWPAYARFIGFPFKTLGLAALLIMAAMAVTSHDYWLAVLGPPAWKALHMGLYAAYGLVVGHVALGAMQSNRAAYVPIVLVALAGSVAILHLLAGRRERAKEAETARPGADGWLSVGPPDSIPDKRARIVVPADGERIAVFRDGRRLAAVTNVCAHQMGPLGEGKVEDGCITCPWHGYQYRLEDGCAPAPFSERLATYRLRLRDGLVEVDPRPLPAGTPASIEW
jgi:nitrite reductase/ring-hydroxylating ferredoxin subunit/DMSO/TMAO reductase YedYZ heme-binding membrane subunit